MGGKPQVAGRAGPRQQLEGSFSGQSGVSPGWPLTLLNKLWVLSAQHVWEVLTPRTPVPTDISSPGTYFNYAQDATAGKGGE